MRRIIPACLAALAFMSSCSEPKATPNSDQLSAVCDQWWKVEGMVEDFDLDADIDKAKTIIRELWVLQAMADTSNVEQDVFSYGNSIWYGDIDQRETYGLALNDACSTPNRAWIAGPAKVI